VSYILEGTILWDKTGDTDRVRIIPQLIQVSDDRHLWSESYQRALTQIFALQTEIATSIARELDVTLLQPERESLRKSPTANVEAYTLYLRGRSLFYAYSRSENEQAIEIFKTVIGMDSLFSLAYAGLSLCYRQYSNSGWDYDERWLRLAEESARHAIALDGGSAEAHFALGFVFEGQADIENMEWEMQKALEINPNHAHAHDGLGDIHSIRGELDDAIREFSAALTINPFLLPSFWCKADVHLKQGRFRDAEITIQKALLIDPENTWLLFTLANTFYMLGKFDQSSVAHNKAVKILPELLRSHLGLGLTHLGRGLFEDARDEANIIYELAGSKSFNFEWTYLLGRISLQQGAYVDARKQFELILAVDTLSEMQFSHAHFALGECFLQMSNYREAIGEFNRVGSLAIGRFQHNYPWATRCYKLGICYEALGEKDSAIAQYVSFLDIWRNADDGIEMIEDAKERLAKLKN
ncbi:MAG: tetratricopeptide repeat protein, partial [candidate division Zixibacteria bacterium]|nr:tetratricopeptide repeat protein [candidate division Zixibacteria bacterium]